jgi:hypothetical protein
MITADQLVIHAIGDYILQSDWVATTKTKKSVAALAHVVMYSLPFLLLTQAPAALAFIAGTHFVIDRWRLARFVCWAKNWIAVPSMKACTCNGPDEKCSECDKPVINLPWSRCTATGYPPDRSAWLTVWLLIITDNIMHVVLNGIALRYLT